MQGKKIKIFIADDHHVFREGIRVLLENELPIEVVGEASTGEEVMQKIKDQEVDVLLLDIDMPKQNGLTLMKILFQNYSQLPVLVFSSHDDEEYIHHMIKNGAKGYILKSCTKEELILAIQTVKKGEAYLCSKVSTKLFQYLKRKEKDAQKKANSPLTKREIEILKLVAKGLTNQEIGKLLFISHRTVDTHRRNMMVKLDLHNAVELTNYAFQNGFIREDEIK